MVIDVERVNKALTKERYVHSSEIEQMLNTLQWAKEFMDSYERKHKKIRIGK